MNTEMNMISQVEPLHGATFAPVADEPTLLRLKQELSEIDARIKTWIKIGKKEKINIEPEQTALANMRILCLEDHKMDLSELVEREALLCSTLVQKVKGNLHRVPEQAALDTLNTKLQRLTNESVTPWIQRARREGIDIEEEFEVMKAANITSLETLREGGRNEANVKEVVQRRLFTLRLQCTIRIVQKVYRERIERLAKEEMALDWYNDLRNEQVLGIKTDALSQLPREGGINFIENKCAEVFECFRKSLQLSKKNPELYGKLADREWLKKEVNQRGRDLSHYAFNKGDKILAKEIFDTLQFALSLFDTDKSTEEIRGLVNHCFDLYAERVTGKHSLVSCGFMESGSGSGRYNARRPDDDSAH